MNTENYLNLKKEIRTINTIFRLQVAALSGWVLAAILFLIVWGQI